MRPRISNDDFNPERMLRKAMRGDYPNAARYSEHRAEEIAYWRERCGLAPEVIEAEVEPDADEVFLGLPRARQRVTIHGYLLSNFEDDWNHGAYLCTLAGLRLPAEAHAAWTAWHERLAGWQRRVRLAARKTDRAIPVSGMVSVDFEQQLSFTAEE